MTIIRSLTGKVHAQTCPVRGRAWRILAPDLPDDEVGAFLVARGVKDEDFCGLCVKPLVATRKTSI